MSATIIVLLITAFFILLPAMILKNILSSKPDENKHISTPRIDYPKSDETNAVEAPKNAGVAQPQDVIRASQPACPGASDRTSDGDAIVQKLKGYDNDRLAEIINSKNMYNSEVVEKARAILGRREAWEQIKDLSDEKLLEITMTDSELYTENIIEAASMELYQRDSQLLRDQFAALDPATLAAIANGTAPAPEGIRLAACKYSRQS